MHIQEIEDRDSALINILVDIWEQSTRATHTFVPEPEILRIKQYIPEALRDVPELIIAQDELGNPLGFMGIDGTHLEMLFIDPQNRGRGIGKQLLEYGIKAHGVHDLTVNEQNPQAVGFYEHLGFVTYKRSDVDEYGDPFPILYMRLEHE
ncbi:GNAT family N-acetyltransferase [Alloscardovia theropitheci]|uniref:GNAT family N-acetyltransferase n=1 Tax=Alloscardovia theropitheci TaxID=2496842 RepID=A0A4R0QZE1_9BIFI|nr:GNAT family N-acetyltransferase [Alloscardovia theropitheci]TCD53986.1 GNAT family N-acetyltransferase [Alloscardovia theropitheci]